MKGLDLFCGAGGASKGYTDAGHTMVGVDIMPQKNYPYSQIIKDSLHISIAYIRQFDFVHASPPCQAFTRMINPSMGRQSHSNLIDATRLLLATAGVPYIIENVPLSPLIDPIELCGQMFGLSILRHRLFESSLPINQPSHTRHTYYQPFNGYNESDWRYYAELDWMTTRESRQAIPPRYTQWIGTELTRLLET